jgi:DNA transposition AAA+ family ATPase
MKRVFVKTSNVKNFISAVTRLQNRQEDIPGMALIYSDPGLGKTKTALWWVAQNDGIFLRTKKLMTGRWLLEELVVELGEAPMNRVATLYRQARELLLDKRKMVFVDEVDYLTHDARVIETLRDLHDDTGVPFIFIGMGMADKKLMRYRHLYDRFSEIVKFTDLTEADVRTIADEMCEVKLKDDAVKFIHSQATKFRRIIVWLYRAEHIARTNGLKEIAAEHLKNGRRK